MKKILGISILLMLVSSMAFGEIKLLYRYYTQYIEMDAELLESGILGYYTESFSFEKNNMTVTDFVTWYNKLEGREIKMDGWDCTYTVLGAQTECDLDILNKYKQINLIYYDIK